MAAECSAPEPEVEMTFSEVSSSTTAMETEDSCPWPSTNPFSPLYSSAVSDGATPSEPSADSGASPAQQDWEWIPQLQRAAADRYSTPPGSVSGRSTPCSLSSGGWFTPLSAASPARGWSTPLSVASPARGRSTPLSAAASPGGRFRCEVCRMDLTGPEPLKQHLAGAKHLKMVASSPGPLPGSSVDCVDSAPPAALGGGFCGVSETAGGGSGSLLDDPCRSIRVGSQLHDLLDRTDGISERTSLQAGDWLRQLHPEGLVAFLEDIPLVRLDQPFSRARC